MKYSSIILVAINVAVFIIQAVSPQVTQDFALTSSQLAQQPWTLVTSMFLHGSVSHILGNMFALGLFGFLLENIISTKKFLTIYFLSGITAGLAASLFYTSSIGASGAIFGVMGALAAMRPRMTVWTYGVPMPMFVAAIFWLALDVAGAFYPSNIANAAHIAGLVFGVFAGLSLKKNEPNMPRQRTKHVSDEEFTRWEDGWMKK